MPKEPNSVSNQFKTCRKKVPSWLVILDNIPTLIVYILGTLIIYQISHILSLLYCIYSLLSIVCFWARICTYCHYYGTPSCPCGYGIISARLFKKKKGKDFKTVFKKNIPFLFPSWFIPPIWGGCFLIHHYSNKMLFIVILFCLFAFILIPLISKLAGCKNCEIRDNCPWMNKSTTPPTRGEA